MPQLTPIKLDDGTVIYVESSEDVSLTKGLEAMKSEEELLVSKGEVMESAVQKFKSIEGTIQSYTAHTLNSFKEIASALLPLPVNLRRLMRRLPEVMVY